MRRTNIDESQVHEIIGKMPPRGDATLAEMIVLHRIAMFVTAGIEAKADKLVPTMN
jgi:hypothetical protein